MSDSIVNKVAKGSAALAIGAALVFATAGCWDENIDEGKDLQPTAGVVHHMPAVESGSLKGRASCKSKA